MSGRIMIDGSPLPSGAIMLDPGTEREGTAVGATIQDGAFSIGRDEGPTPGTYKVASTRARTCRRLRRRVRPTESPGRWSSESPIAYNTRTEVNRSRSEPSGESAGRRCKVGTPVPCPRFTPMIGDRCRSAAKEPGQCIQGNVDSR